MIALKQSALLKTAWKTTAVWAAVEEADTVVGDMVAATMIVGATVTTIVGAEATVAATEVAVIATATATATVAAVDTTVATTTAVAHAAHPVAEATRVLGPARVTVTAAARYS